jgi:hypothetical protein
MTPQRFQPKDDKKLFSSPPPHPIPTFRSVSMSVRSSPSLQLLHQPPQELRKAHFSPFQKEDKSTGSSWVWKLTNISTVPLYHPLERSAISSTETLSTITARISNFMKAHSIQCSYHDQLGRVDCSTDNLIHFCIQLWKNSNDTVIEIQRQQGCAIAMQGLRQQLNQTILYGNAPNILDNNNNDNSTPSPLFWSFFQKLPITQTPNKRCLESCLELYQQLLESNMMDQNQLGLESLCIIMDPSKVLPSDAEETSRRVLQDGHFQTLLTNFFAPDRDAINYDAQIHSGLHLLALKAISFGLNTLAHQQDLLSIDFFSIFWKTFVEANSQNIRLANERPLEASLSVRSLRLLQRLEPSILSHSNNLGKSLKRAHDYGRLHSQSLQNETELLMMQPFGVVH